MVTTREMLEAIRENCGASGASVKVGAERRDMSKVKKCPHCAWDKTRFEATATPSGEPHGYRVTCLKCGACGPDELSKEQAVESWNMRRRIYPSAQVNADAYEDPRNATPEQLLEATEWFLRQSTSISLAEAEEQISLLHTGFQLAQPGGWEQVAPMWLRESKRIAALDMKGE